MSPCLANERYPQSSPTRRSSDLLARKYPKASTEFRWQWVFPATRTYVDIVTRELRRHHLHPTVIQRAVSEAVRLADRKSTRLNSSHANISYAVFCLKRKNTRSET